MTAEPVVHQKGSSSHADTNHRICWSSCTTTISAWWLSYSRIKSCSAVIASPSTGSRVFQWLWLRHSLHSRLLNDSM